MEEPVKRVDEKMWMAIWSDACRGRSLDARWRIQDRKSVV